MFIARISRRLGWGIIAAMMVALLGALAGVIYAGPSDPPGNLTAGGSTQQGLVFQPASCAGFPIVLGAQGSYKLAQDITGCPGKDGIQITINNVSLDLGGFSVRGGGSGSGSLDGIHVVGGPGQVAVSNGKVRDWGGKGINFATAFQSSISNVMVSSNGGTGIAIGTDTSLSNCSSASNGLVTAGDGIDGTTGQRNVITNCQAIGNTRNGILANTTTRVADCVANNNGIAGVNLSNAGIIEGCEVANNSAEGIYLNGQDVLVQNNNVHNNGSNGIHAQGSRERIEHNNVDSNTGRGIWVHFGHSTVTDNTSTDNTTQGYFIESGGSRVDNNLSAGNLGGGFLVTVAPPNEPNFIIRNTSSDGPCAPAIPFNVDPSNELGVVAFATTSTGSPWNNIAFPCIP